MENLRQRIAALKIDVEIAEASPEKIAEKNLEVLVKSLSDCRDPIIKDESFKFSGIISKKIKNEKFGGLIYPNAINKKQINYFLFFEKLEKENISYSELVRNYSEKTVYNEKGIHVN